MPKVYVQPVEEGENIKYALFEDMSNPPKEYQENWNPVVFDTETEAEEKLEKLEMEKTREDAAVLFSLEDAKKYAESHYWKYASTYAKTAPHEYLVKSWLVEEDQLLFERFVATMKANSVIGYFYGHANNYFMIGNYYYWFMPLPDNLAVGLINRTTIDYLEIKDGVYYYKPH